MSYGLAAFKLRILKMLLNISWRLKIEPNDAVTYKNLALTLKKTGDFQAACINYKKLLKLRQKTSWLTMVLGVFMRKFNDALKAYTQASEIDPNFAEAHNNIGFIFQLMSKADKESL